MMDLDMAIGVLIGVLFGFGLTWVLFELYKRHYRRRP